MTNEELMLHMLDSFPHHVVFADCDHIMRFVNQKARERYLVKSGYTELIGKNMLDCHHEESSKRMLINAVEWFKQGGGEIPMKLTDTLTAIITPVRDNEGVLLGYFNRFEHGVTSGYVCKTCKYVHKSKDEPHCPICSCGIEGFREI